MSGEIIGSRYKDTYDRVVNLLDLNPNLDDKTIEFLENLKSRLETYHENAFISIAQLNYLTRIETDCDRFF